MSTPAELQREMDWIDEVNLHYHLLLSRLADGEKLTADEAFSVKYCANFLKRVKARDRKRKRDPDKDLRRKTSFSSAKEIARRKLERSSQHPTPSSTSSVKVSTREMQIQVSAKRRERHEPSSTPKPPKVYEDPDDLIILGSSEEEEGEDVDTDDEFEPVAPAHTSVPIASYLLLFYSLVLLILCCHIANTSHITAT